MMKKGVLSIIFVSLVAVSLLQVVGADDGLVVDFVYDPNYPLTLEPVFFVDTSTYNGEDVSNYSCNFTWNFGDGNVSYEKDPIHVYAKAGTYNVTHTVVIYENETVIAIGSSTQTIDVRNRNPVAKFYWKRQGDIIMFLDYSYDLDGEIVSWHWDFGDGNTSTKQNPLHIYAVDDVYLVNLTVEDDDGGKNTTIRAINTLNNPPITDFTYYPVYPTDLDTINFTSLSYDVDGYIANWTWDFGDGNVSYEQNPQHKYADNGEYTVRLTTIDDNGAINDIKKVITVLNIPPIVNFSWTPLYPVPYMNVTFNASASHDLDGEIIRYEWDWNGDGIFDENTTQPMINHSWDSKGVYNITLRLTDDDNATSSLSKKLFIADFYVDDDFNESTPGWNITHFNNIQDAVDKATDGTVIYVLEGTYYEDVIIDEGVVIIGKNATVSGGVCSLYIQDNNVNITNLIITNSTTGINISADFAIIQNCKLANNEIGIIINGDGSKVENTEITSYNTSLLIYGNGNELIGNVIEGGIYGANVYGNDNRFIENEMGSNAFYGLYLHGENNEIADNSIKLCSYGIYLANSNTIYDNYITLNGFGIYSAINALLLYNKIENNYYGIYAVDSIGIYDATFKDNTIAIYSNYIFASNLHIEGGGKGIKYEQGEIRNSLIKDAETGIEVGNGTISGCTILSCNIGIKGNYSIILDCNISFNVLGIYLANGTVYNCSLYKNERGMKVANSLIVNVSFDENENGLELRNENTIFNVSLLQNSNGILVKGENNAIINSTAEYNGVGIIVESSHNLIKENYIAYNTYGLKILSAPYNTLFSNTFVGNSYHLDMEGSKLMHFYETIAENNTADGKLFLYLINASGMEFSGSYGYFALINCMDIFINGLNVSHNGEGLLLVECRNVYVDDGNFSYNVDGIYVLNGEDISLVHIEAMDNINGISCKTPSNLLIFHCKAKGNVKGINVFNMESKEIRLTIHNVSLQENGIALNIENSMKVSIENIKTMQNVVDAVFYNSDASIRDSKMVGNEGIKAYDSSIEIFNSTLSHLLSIYTISSTFFLKESNILNSSTAINATSSSLYITKSKFANNIALNISNCSMIAEGSNFSTNDEINIFSSSIKITNTTFYQNINGLRAFNSDGIIENCTFSMNDKGVVSKNSSIDMRNSYMNANRYAIIVNSSNNRIFGGVYYNNSVGILINGSANIIEKVLFQKNERGVLINGMFNEIINCSFWKNLYGIVAGGENNTIYHNNFIYNTVENAVENGNNIWYHPYPDGGNYWYDYAGEDLFSGVGQNESGSDGIGDIPYEIDSNIDKYPLMNFSEGAAPMPNVRPIASFSFYPLSPYSFEDIIFIDNSYDENGKKDIVSWEWDFGDGNVSYERNPSHMYKKPGCYNVTLIVKDRAGNESEAEIITVCIKNLPPFANFSWYPISPFSYNSTEFDAGSSYDMDGYITNYTWTIMDILGTVLNVSYGEVITQKFTIPGKYKIILYVRDNDDGNTTIEKWIEVKNRKPKADFEFTPDKPVVGEAINFTDFSIDMDGKIMEWKWVFGDGSISYE
ncbi:MAG: PKD domain-containing protein, partial [Thermoplasmata archaeon]